MADQSLFQGRQHSNALLAQRREIAADAAKGQSASTERKQPETFCWTLTMRISRSARLLSKGTAKLSRNSSTASWCVERRSSRLRAADCLRRPRLPDFRWRIGRVGPIAFFQQGGIACFPVGHLQRMQAGAALGSRLLDGGFDVQQQRLSSGLPSLAAVLRAGRSVRADGARCTERVLTGIAPIGLPAIMHAHPLEVCEDADGVQRLVAPFGMHGIMRQLLGRTHMHPVPLACDIEARFILMQHAAWPARL